MNGVNKLILLGRLTSDAELRYAQGGAAALNFSVAVNESWKDKSGHEKQVTEFTSCVLWGVRAEKIAPFLKKGMQVYVEGKKRTRKWKAKDGAERESVELQVEQVQWFNKGNGGQQQEMAP